MNKEIEKLIKIAISDHKISKSDVDIILKEVQEKGFNEEELRVYLENRLEQEFTKNNCPNCGAPVSVLSNFCNTCGQILENKSNKNRTLDDFLTTIKKNIKALKEFPENLFISMLKDNFVYFLLFISIISFFVATKGFLFLVYISVILFIISLFLIFRKLKKFTKKRKISFEHLVSSYEGNIRIMKFYYQGNTDIVKQIEIFDNQANNIKAQRKQKKRNITIIFLVFMIISGSSLFFIQHNDKYSKVKREIAKIEQNDTLFNSEYNINPSEITISGKLSEYIKVKNLKYNIHYKISPEYSEKAYIFLEIANIRIEFLKEFKEKKYPNFNFTINIADEKGKIIDFFPTFEFNRKLRDDFINLLLDGSGTNFFNFSGGEYNKESDDIKKQIEILKGTENLHFIIDVDYKR